MLINESDVELGWLKPYFVRRDDNTDAFPVSPRVPDSPRCSALWRGYVANMRLHFDYRLKLEHFDFPLPGGRSSQICNAFFDGDFSITFRPFFFGPNTVVPFRDGRIVQHVDEWQIDDQTMDGVVSSVVHDRHTNKPIGVRVEIGGLAFAPRSLVPVGFRGKLNTIVGRSVACTIAEIDEEERGKFVVQIERFADS